MKIANSQKGYFKENVIFVKLSEGYAKHRSKVSPSFATGRDVIKKTNFLIKGSSKEIQARGSDFVKHPTD